MKYVRLTKASEQYADSISRWMWSMSRPAPGPNDVTVRYVGWIVHPTRGDVALCLPEEDTQPISQNANPKKLVDVIRENITTEEAATLENSLREAKGKKADISSFIPNSVKNRVLTEEELIQDGWYSEDSLNT